MFSILMVGVVTCSYMKGSSDKDSVSTDSDESSEKGDMVINVDSVIAAHRSEKMSLRTRFGLNLRMLRSIQT